MARIRSAAPGRILAGVPEATRAAGTTGSMGTLTDGAPSTQTPSGVDEESGAGQESGSQARQRILDAAEGLFAADGFDATPTSRDRSPSRGGQGAAVLLLPAQDRPAADAFCRAAPCAPLVQPCRIAVTGDLAGSLVRLADRVGLTHHHSVVLSEILFREAKTHPDVREHLQALHTALMELTEAVLDAANPRALDRGRRKAAAGTFVAVLMREANFHRFDGPVPDLGATAEIVSSGLAP
jgi:hypothetical protein